MRRWIYCKQERTRSSLRVLLIQVRFDAGSESETAHAAHATAGHTAGAATAGAAATGHGAGGAAVTYKSILRPSWAMASPGLVPSGPCCLWHIISGGYIIKE